MNPHWLQCKAKLGPHTDLHTDPNPGDKTLPVSKKNIQSRVSEPEPRYLAEARAVILAQLRLHLMTHIYVLVHVL